MNQTYERFSLPCRASNIRGQLKHTYLTNKICLKALPEDLKDSMLFEEKGIPQHNLIRSLILELQETMGSVDNGFSPAQLVDQLKPFRELPDEIKSAMKNTIHLQFLQDFCLSKRLTKFKRISSEFLTTLDSFIIQDQGSLEESFEIMKKVQDCARALIRELETLPKGIWLWDTENSK